MTLTYTLQLVAAMVRSAMLHFLIFLSIYPPAGDRRLRPTARLERRWLMYANCFLTHGDNPINAAGVDLNARASDSARFRHAASLRA